MKQVRVERPSVIITKAIQEMENELYLGHKELVVVVSVKDNIAKLRLLRIR